MPKGSKSFLKWIKSNFIKIILTIIGGCAAGSLSLSITFLIDYGKNEVFKQYTPVPAGKTAREIARRFDIALPTRYEGK